MKNNFKLASLISLLAFIGCKDSTTNPLSSKPAILMESNFEVNGIASLDQWKRVDTLKRAELFFSNDVPLDSVIHYSLGIKSNNVFGKIMTFLIPNTQNRTYMRTFHLSYWAKGSSFNMPNISPYLEVISSYNYEGQGGGTHTTQWQQYSLTVNIDDPAIFIFVSIVLWPTTSKDTTEYTLFTGFRLEGE